MRTDDTYILTFSGRKCWPLDPRPEDIHIVDIAHALSQICRFTGHTREFYSVAQHSTIVAQILLDRSALTRIALCGLLHDASEAYLCDVPRPLKQTLVFSLYRTYEYALQQCIETKFNVISHDRVIVKHVDDQILHAELSTFMKIQDHALRRAIEERAGSLIPYFAKPVRAEQAEIAFLQMFLRLTTANEAARV